MSKNDNERPSRLDALFSHESLAWFFVMALYGAGMVMTALLILKVVTWGWLASYGRVRMVGLIISLAGAGFFLSRIVAGRYGNRLAARLMPHHLEDALSARLVMGRFGLTSGKALNAFIVLHKLRVYSVAAPIGEGGLWADLAEGWSLSNVNDDVSGDLAELPGVPGEGRSPANGAHPLMMSTRNLPCMLEPLFTHDMYLPMMRTWLVRSNRLWFDGSDIRALVSAEQKRYQNIVLP